MAKFHSGPGLGGSSFSPGLICSGCVVLVWGMACLSCGFVYLSACPRHPLLPVWLISLGGLLLLVSVAIFALPSCAKTSVTPHTSKVLLWLLSWSMMGRIFSAMIRALISRQTIL